MQDTTAYQALDRFRREVYDRALGCRKDTLFELMEAALVAVSPAPLVRLSVESVFGHRWPSAADALADGRVAADQCRGLAHAHLAQLPRGDRPVWALDGTVWPRPAAQTSPERTWGHWTSPGRPQSGIIAAWEYQ